jgi:hypothetical protein
VSDIDLAAIRARVEDTTDLRGDTPWHHRMVKSATDVPALLALVDAQAARIDKALVLHYAMEWHEETEAGSGELDLSKPLPPFCAECTDSDYVEAIEDGDTIDAASDVVGWPCATYRALTEDVTP